MTSIRLFLTSIALVFIVAGCGSAQVERPLSTGIAEPVTGRDLRIVTGQTVFVPAYSEIFNGQDERRVALAVTLAIHNTDLQTPIIIQSVRYYDTNGQLVHDFVDTPLALTALASTGFLIEESDTAGGWGSNFIVEWVAEAPVHEPVIEAVMISTRNASGLSMISPGRVISQTPQIQTTTDE